ncbi:hypothetical protein [Roseovarius sp. A-2]|uniref:hypothetical protein n=1 Tax=Roseovarius sp. A-2 TaxID=1570360 RepID=UPI001118B1E4|nr:hypothetical protein [Roseovarius sp. A-2]
MPEPHKTIKTPGIIAGWQDRLSPGDILMFRFPITHPITSGCPVPRPCLVLDIEIVHGRRCALLSPAFPAHRFARHSRRISIDRKVDWRAAGLERATRFSIRARRLVPLVHDDFVISASSGTPLLGRLPEVAKNHMNAERARIHALRDIRRDCEPCHAQSDTRQDRGFTVERRNIRRPLPLPRAGSERSGR